jgi:hypothetical protein
MDTSPQNLKSLGHLRFDVHAYASLLNGRGRREQSNAFAQLRTKELAGKEWRDRTLCKGIVLAIRNLTSATEEKPDFTNGTRQSS